MSLTLGCQRPSLPCQAMGLCEVCGRPTTSKYGVCLRGTRACNLEYQRRWWAAKRATKRESAPCGVCGEPTTSKLGVCKRTPECEREYGRRAAQQWRDDHRSGPPRVPCEACGRPTSSVLRVCRNGTEECARLYQWRHNHPDWETGEREPLTRVPCEICGHITHGQYGCVRTPACKRAWLRRWRAGNREGVRLASRRYRDSNGTRIRERERRQRAANREVRRRRERERYAANRDAIRERNRRNEATVTRRRARARYRAANPDVARKSAQRQRRRLDRPCRYAKAGCTEFAIRNKPTCAKHTSMDAARYQARKSARLRERLASSQGGRCAWCRQPLPDGLSHTHIDHIIPVSRGGPQDEWNLQLLHDVCNMSKNSRITPRALALAVEHGITITVAVPEPMKLGV